MYGCIWLYRAVYGCVWPVGLCQPRSQGFSLLNWVGESPGNEVGAMYGCVWLCMAM